MFLSTYMHSYSNLSHIAPKSDFSEFKGNVCAVIKKLSLDVHMHRCVVFLFHLHAQAVDFHNTG